MEPSAMPARTGEVTVFRTAARLLGTWAVLACLGLPIGAGAETPFTLKTSVTTDVSDIWWNPNESGWGMQLVQSDDIVFATVFIYGADGKPTWVTAELTYVGSGVFTGPLYVTTGPYFPGPFNPGNVTVRVAGTMTFTNLTVQTAQLQYSIDGVSVSKALQRQSLKTDNYTGGYLIAVNLTQSSCFNPANNSSGTGAFGITVSQTATAMSMVWQFATNDICTYSGAFSQSGKMGRFSGTFACTTGETGNMVFFEMTNRIGMLSGRIQGTSTTYGCAYSGRFTGINPNVP
jgi:hypothetical protein